MYSFAATLEKHPCNVQLRVYTTQPPQSDQEERRLPGDGVHSYLPENAQKERREACKRLNKLRLSWTGPDSATLQDRS